MDLPSARNRRLIILSMLTVAAALFAIAVIVYQGNPRSTDLPVAIQAVAPEAGSNVLSQTDVSVDLAVGIRQNSRSTASRSPKISCFESML